MILRDSLFWGKFTVPVLTSILILGIFGFSALDQQAHAFAGTISTEASCIAAGGLWSSPDTCTIISDQTIAFEEIWVVHRGVTLTINQGVTVTMSCDFMCGTLINGVIINNGVINNSGVIDNNGGTLINNFGGVINNSGVINNDGTFTNNKSDNDVDVDGIINNFHIINNYGTFINNGIINNSHIINNFCVGILTGPIPTSGNAVVQECVGSPTMQIIVDTIDGDGSFDFLIFNATNPADFIIVNIPDTSINNQSLPRFIQAASYSVTETVPLNWTLESSDCLIDGVSHGNTQKFNIFNGQTVVCTFVNLFAPNESPVADAGGPYIGVAGTLVQFDGTATDPNPDDVLTFSWDFGDGDTGAGESPTHIYSDDSGSPYTVTLTVTDDGTPLLSDTATTIATITSPPPPDSDGDGIPDAVDQCPGVDDTIDINTNGIPDCIDPLLNPYSLNTVETQITTSTSFETTPVLARDSVGLYVVYVSQEDTGGGLGPGDVYYQRLHNDGTPNGAPILINTLGGIENNVLSDASGDYIVYTAFDTQISMNGSIKLYQISTGITTTISASTSVLEPKINGNNIVWVEGSPGATQVMSLAISDIGTGTPITIIGPSPPAEGIEIGDRFVVSTVVTDGQFDVQAYDLLSGTSFPVAASPTIFEFRASSDGSWISYLTLDLANPSEINVIARNLNTFETRIIDNRPTVNDKPSVAGNLVTYESDINGDRDVYVYRLSEADTFRVTTNPADQFLNNAFENYVTYVDNSNTQFDIFVSSLTFILNDPCASSGGDSDGDGVCDDNDNAPNISNPDQADGDGDGVGDVADNCVSISNANQADSDGNGVGDVCEVTQFGIVDQSNPHTATASGTILGILEPGQEFIPTASSISGLDLFLGQSQHCGGLGSTFPCTPSSTVTVEILEGTNVLGSTNRIVDTVGGDFFTPLSEHLDFGTAIPLTSGNTYAIKVSADNNHYLWTCNGNSYPPANQLPPNIGVGGTSCDYFFVTYFDLPSLPDADGDGIADSIDNCPADSNTDQSDIDADGTGDVCDDDADNDGIQDILDTEIAIPPTIFDFTDGTSSGTIISGNQFLTITDVPGPGIHFSATGPASVTACGIALITFVAGDAETRCGSITIVILSGSADIVYTADDGTTTTTELNEGDDVTYDESNSGQITNNGSGEIIISVNGEGPIPIGAGETITIGSPPSTIQEQVVALKTLVSETLDDPKDAKKLAGKLDKLTKSLNPPDNTEKDLQKLVKDTDKLLEKGKISASDHALLVAAIDSGDVDEINQVLTVIEISEKDLKKLTKTLDKLGGDQSPNIGKACKELDGFIKETNKLESKGKLTPVEFSSLIAAANNIKTEIGCS